MFGTISWHLSFLSLFAGIKALSLENTIWKVRNQKGFEVYGQLLDVHISITSWKSGNISMKLVKDVRGPSFDLLEF